MAREDGPFRFLAKVEANAYKLELPRNMAVSATFNVGDLSLYVDDEVDYRDLRANPFKGRKEDVDQGPYQDPQPGPEKTMLLDHHQGQSYETLQLNLEATLGRSLLCWTP